MEDSFHEEKRKKTVPGNVKGQRLLKPNDAVILGDEEV